MKPIKDIQGLLSERAEKKLDKELSTMREYIHNGFAANLLELGDDVTLTIDGKTKTLREALWYTDRPIFKRIKEKLLPIYIEDETKAFVKEVDGLRKQMENIVGQLPQFEDY